MKKVKYNPELFKQNNFDLLRFIAASQVALVHGIEHFKLESLYEFATWISFIPGVPIFFFLSGLLISAAWERNPDLRVFFGNRFYRIFPGLWLCVFLSVIMIVVCGFVLNENIPYFSVLIWSIMQGTFLPHWNPEFLNWFGIGVVNGSLWTIPVELSFYFFVPIVYALSVKSRISIDKFFLILLVISFAVFQTLILMNYTSDLQLLLGKLTGFTPIPWFWMFCCGVLAQRSMKIIYPLILNKVHIFLVIFLSLSFIGYKLNTPILFGTGNQLGIVNWLALSFLVLSFGYSFPWFADKVLDRNDISYGVYIYHMPIFNCAISLGLIGKFGLFIGLLVTVLFAIISWKFLEKPFLRKRKNFLYSR